MQNRNWYKTKYPRLPSLKRCNTKATFPYNFHKYKPIIYCDGLPAGYIPLDYSLGVKVYTQFYNFLIKGNKKGIIYKDKEKGKWKYGIDPKDLQSKRIGLKEKASEALKRPIDLPDEKYVTLKQAAKLVGFSYHTLKANEERSSLLAELPTAQDYIDLKLDKRTKLIVLVGELKMWLKLVASGEVPIYGYYHQQSHPLAKPTETKRYKLRRHNLEWRDREQRRYGYRNWRTPATPENKGKQIGRKPYAKAKTVLDVDE